MVIFIHIVVAYKDQGWHCYNEYFMVLGFLGVIASEAWQSLRKAG